MPRKPSWFSAVCIIGMILGALMVLSGVYGLLNIVLSGSMASFGMPSSGGPGLQKLQQEMQEKMFEATMPGVGVALSFLRITIAGGVVFALAQTLKLSPLWRERSSLLLSVAAVWELAEVAYTVTIGIRTHGIMSDYMKRIMTLSSTGSTPPGFADGMSTVMSATFIASLAFGAGWSIVKLVWWVYSRFYLIHPKLDPLFPEGGGGAGPDAAAP